MIFWIAGYVTAAAALALLLWALCSDRARARRRCPNCWYDLAGVPGLTCPECGRTARSEACLARTRRRWRWVAAAVVLLLASSFIHSTPRIAGRGAIGAVPTTALIWWVGAFEPEERCRSGLMSQPSRWAAELAVRADGELWRWQWVWMVRRLEVVRAHPIWPRGRAFEVSTGVPSWLGRNWSRYTFASSLPKAGGVMPGHMFAWQVGELDEADPRVVITVTSSTVTNTLTGRGGYSMQWPLRVRLVDRAEDCLEPVRGAEIDAAVRVSLRAALKRDENEKTQTDSTLVARLDRERGGLADAIAIGIVVEFLRGGAVAASYPLCLRDSIFGEPVDWVRINVPGPGWQDEDADEASEWTVRIRGDAATALGDVRRRKYWAGEFTMPLRQFMGLD